MLIDSIDRFIDSLILANRSKETINGYRNELLRFLRYIEFKYNGPVYVSRLDLEDLESYLKSMKDKGDKAVSLNRSIYILRSFYNFLVKRNMVYKNIAQLLEPLKVKEESRENLKEEEIRELLKKIDHSLIRLAVKTMAYTGLRVSELCNLKIQDVDLKDNLIYVVNGKGGKDRTVPINIDLKKDLVNYIKYERPNVDGERFFATERSAGLSPQYINKHIKEAVVSLGWKRDITAHVLRHSFASNLIRNGASLVSVQKLLGHSDLRVTSRYLHQDLDELEEAVNLI